MGNNTSALLEAASNGDSRAVELALRKTGASDLSSCDEDGWTALHYAASQGHQGIVCTLLSHGADVNQVDKSGETALHLAAASGATAVARDLLRKGAAVGAADEEGMTALHQASVRGHTAIVGELLWQHADINSQTTSGWTALHLAACKAHPVTVDLLLQKHADLEVVNADGRTALHVAAGQGHQAIVQQLLQANADALVVDKTGATAADWAEVSGHTETAALLGHMQHSNSRQAPHQSNAPSAPILPAESRQQAAMQRLNTAAVPAHNLHGQSATADRLQQVGLSASNSRNTADLVSYPAVFRPSSHAASRPSVTETESAGTANFLSRLQGWIPQSVSNWHVPSAPSTIREPVQESSQPVQPQSSRGYGLLENDSEDEEQPAGSAPPAVAVQEANALERQLANMQLQHGATPPAAVAQSLPFRTWRHYSMEELDYTNVSSEDNPQLISLGHLAPNMTLSILHRKPVVVYQLQRQSLDPQAVHVLDAQLSAVAALRHAHIAPVIGGSLESGGAVVYDVGQCCTLDDMLGGNYGNLPFHERLAAAARCCDALAYLHAQGLKHGSLDTTHVLLPTRAPACCQLVCNLHTLDNLNVQGRRLHDVSDTWVTSTQYDVVSLGILMLQLLTARQTRGLAADVALKLRNGSLDVDLCCGLFQQSQADEFATIALRCATVSQHILPMDIHPQLLCLAEDAAASARATQSTSTPVNNQHPSHQGTFAGTGDSVHSASRQSSSGSSSIETTTTQILELYTCPISQDLMHDPVVADDGWTYDRIEIQKWFDQGKHRSPMTNAPLASTKLVPNRRIKSAIEEWKQQQGRQ